MAMELPLIIMSHTHTRPVSLERHVATTEPMWVRCIVSSARQVQLLGLYLEWRLSIVISCSDMSLLSP